MKKLYTYVFLASLILISSVSFVFAQNVSLSWDPSTDPNVVGYKIYYKAGSADAPFDGVGAQEGASPIDVGNNSTATLTNLPDGQVYYIAVTAYDASQNESGFSNIVTSQWTPTLNYPADGDTNVQVPVQFSWSEPPAGTNVTYTLYYGTDPNLDPANLATNQTGSLPPAGRSTLLAGAFFLALFGLVPSRRKKMKSLFTVAVCGLALTLSSCGNNSNLSGLTLPVTIGSGGTITLPGSSTDGSSQGSITTGSSAVGTGQTTPSPYTEVVSGLSDSYYDATDLQPSTKYYWKVVASDGQSQVESLRGSFTTEGN